jgi:hypothetical protein
MGGSLGGLLGTAATVGLLSIIIGNVGSLVGRLDLGLGLRGWFMLRKGDLSWSPRGEGDLESVGSLMGPNGDTLSCTFNHDPRVGAFGGFDGFQATEVVLTSGSRGLLPGVNFGYSENDPREPLPGSFRAPL